MSQNLSDGKQVLSERVIAQYPILYTGYQHQCSRCQIFSSMSFMDGAVGIWEDGSSCSEVSCGPSRPSKSPACMAGGRSDGALGPGGMDAVGAVFIGFVCRPAFLGWLTV